MGIKENILKVIRSEAFKARLCEINNHYFNLKQESFIRNAVLEALNKRFSEQRNQQFRAIAEHPRINNTRIDLSVVDRQSREMYRVEFKFHFTKDFNPKENNYTGYINRDYNASRGTDMYILVVASWDIGEKEEFDAKWGIEPSRRLSKYIARYTDWEQYFDAPFERYNELTDNSYLSDFCKIELLVDQPYRTRYLFYVLWKQ